MIPSICDLLWGNRMIDLLAVEEIVKSIEDKFGEILLTVAVAALSYAWTSAKSWFQQGSGKDRQMALNDEANRLRKLRETLGCLNNPSPNVTRALSTVDHELNETLENLSHLLAEPCAVTQHSRFWTLAGKYLLLYRPPSIFSNLLHWIFYLLVAVWLIIGMAGFTVNETGTNVEVCIVLLIPVVVWNYITRKFDDWLRRRRTGAPALAKAGT